MLSEMLLKSPTSVPYQAQILHIDLDRVVNRAHLYRGATGTTSGYDKSAIGVTPNPGACLQEDPVVSDVERPQIQTLRDTARYRPPDQSSTGFMEDASDL